MASVFVARLWLSCQSNNPDPFDTSVVSAFNARFTQTIEQQWQTIVLSYDTSLDPDANKARLAEHLSTRINTTYGQAGGWMSQDIPSFQSLKVPVFDAQSWSMGSGGLHEAKKPVNAALAGAGQAQWSFLNADKDFSGTMFAHCEWSVADVS